MNTRPRANRRRPRLSAILGLLLLPALPGCGGAIVGEWYLAEAVPNREVFSMDQASFHRDGTFAATMTIEGLTNSQAGKYEFNGYKLKLRPGAGGQRIYYASIRRGELRVLDGSRRVVLKKARKGS